MKERTKRAETKKFEQLFDIKGIALVAVSEELVFARIADQDLSDKRVDEIKEPGRMAAGFKGNVKGAGDRGDEITNRVGVGLDDGIDEGLALRILNLSKDGCLMNIKCDILVVNHIMNSFGGSLAGRQYQTTT